MVDNTVIAGLSSSLPHKMMGYKFGQVRYGGSTKVVGQKLVIFSKVENGSEYQTNLSVRVATQHYTCTDC